MKTLTIIGSIRRKIKKVNYNLFSLIGHYNYTPFIILTRSRSGSNMLASFLQSHPNIRCDGEIFNNLKGKNFYSILDKTFTRQPYSVKCRGFKIFYYHPQDMNNKELFWNELTEINNLHVIHLKRKNILRTIVSRKIAGKTNTWASPKRKSTNKKQNINITLTPNELKNKFKETQRWINQGDELFKKHKKVSLYYEDLVNNPREEFKKVTEFLGVKFVEPNTNFQKQNPEKLNDLITNYDELKIAFSNTEWEDFFTD